MAQPRNRLSAPMASYGRFLNRLAQAQSAPGSLYDVARARRQRAFYEEADRRAREIGQYGRELNPFERMTATLPQSTPEGVAEVLPAVMGAQFAGGAAGAVLDDPINALANLANPRIPANVIPATVYHGSPHRINNVTPDAPYGRFDMSKIGTGEGAQAYGHGVYLAENPGVARSYQGELSGDLIVSDEVRERLMGLPRVGNTQADAMSVLAGSSMDLAADPKGTASYFRSLAKRAGIAEEAKTYSALADAIDAGEVAASKGHFYTVDLPDAEIAKMLDWDAPLSEQPKKVQELLSKVSRKTPSLEDMNTERLRNLLERVDPNGNYRFWEDTGAVISRDELLEMALDADEMVGDALEDYLGSEFLGQQSGEGIYSQLVAELGGQDAASEALRAAGIPGIRYFDAGSRAAGEGTRNFVIFDPDTVRIMSRE